MKITIRLEPAGLIRCRFMLRYPIAVASMVLGCVLVNAAESVNSKQLPQFLRAISRDGGKMEIRRGLATTIGLDGSRAPFPERHQGWGADNVSRVFRIISDPKSKHTIALVMSVTRMINSGRSEDHFFRLSPEGVLEYVAFGSSTYKDGKVVKGAGKAEKVDLDAPGVRDEYQRELDFWLSGKYREPQKP